ncbi:MAG: hypothetical protein WCX22_06095 [Methanoregula sp.]
MRPEAALFIERALILEKWTVNSSSKKLYNDEMMDEAEKTARQLSFILSDEGVTKAMAFE